MDTASYPYSTDTLAQDSTSLSSSELLFPVAKADGSISNLIDEHPSKNMHVHIDHDEESLAGSTYDFVDTDVESRGDHDTASIASTDIDRPDDVASLADTESSGDESDEGQDNSGPGVALPSLAHTSLLETPTISGAPGAVYDQAQVGFIEFAELPLSGSESISVRHTIDEFSEELTKDMAEKLNLREPPQNLLLTIRQTMSKSGIVTKDPLRVLYIGSHAARQDIITKIASCLSASSDQMSRDSQSQVYNVVPISPNAVEEVELMQSSGIQIKIEDCMMAESMPYESNPERPDVIKLSISDTVAYHSVPEKGTYIVSPSWDLPHVAIFYCSPSDTTQAKQTRSLVRRFMSRHNIPSLVIAHQTTFDRTMYLSLDQHVVHMCLEARDISGRGSIIRQRLPIDLTSFLKIDARQMSRNLAYITGLCGTSDASIQADDKPARALTVSPSHDKKAGKIPWVHNISKPWITKLIASCFVFLLLLAASNFMPSVLWTSPAPAISINSQMLSSIMPTLSHISGHSSSSSVTTKSNSASISAFPRLPKLDVPRGQQQRSLSLIPSKEIRVVPVASPTTVESNRIVCSAEIISPREILIHLPATKKSHWLSRDLISVNVTRNGLNVSTEKVSNTDKGIVLLLVKGEAYGTLDISIATSRKPRIDETLHIDLGTTRSQTVRNIKSKMCSMLSNNLRLLAKTVDQNKQKPWEMLAGAHLKTLEMQHSARSAAQKASTLLQDSTRKLKESSEVSFKAIGDLSKDMVVRSTTSISHTIKTFSELQTPFQQELLRAQVQSKLAWLKLQGRTAEYEDYKRRAFKAHMMSHQAIKLKEKSRGGSRGKACRRGCAA